MNLADILNQLDSKATSVTFEVKNTGCDSWHVRIIPNHGKDFLLPTQYETPTEARDAIKQLNIAYRLGLKIRARLVFNSLNKHI